ncbi:DNA-binding MarR family transcriptional regulator [Streptomyces sp. B3I7]|jgi:DNA-binding MarR family transcriptional regulator|nr:DNA-binding MarR family transcriptional regulator [Streptomyces sp. B3I8]MDQ0814762.1 DNA-binding MarR family transcriptional regulator [Streptomyces sp. B3I7]
MTMSGSADHDGPSHHPQGPSDRFDAEGLLAEQLMRLTRRVHRIQKHHLQERNLGVTPAQSRLLRTLAHYGEPPRMADLAARLEVVPRAVTTLVDGLEASGKVRRVPDPTNRRVTRIELTDDGLASLRELHAARRSAVEEILAPLSVDQRTALEDLLDALVEGPHGGGTRTAPPPNAPARPSDRPCPP